MRTFSSLILLLIFLSSCEEDQLKPDLNRYVKAADVFSLPKIQYDSDGSPPDVRIDLKRRSASFWEFSTYTEQNAATLPLLTIFPAEILLTDEVYELRIVDEDLNEADDDEIFYWSFQAMDEGENGEFNFYGDGKLILSLQYNEK